MKAYIVAGFRSAVGKANKGGFRFMRSDDLASKVIEQLVGSIKNFENKMVDDLIVGNAVLKQNKVCKWADTSPF